MNPTELMIGDWVFNKHHKKYIQITPYDFFNHAHLPSGEKYFVSELKVISGRDFEPIPLTIKILKKNGLEKVIDEDGTECYRYYNRATNGYVKISLYDGGDSDWSIEIINYEKFNDNEIVYSNNFIFLKVHELQHMLRLCNLNELANNLKLENNHG